MTWILEQPKSQKQLAEEFLTLVKEKTILQVPGAHDAMAGIIAKKAGFNALYLSGGAFTASLGIPDLGVLQSTEVAERANEIVRATNLPILVDIDTGFGGVLNVARTAMEMVEARVAAVQIEDQQLPKKCGHLNGKQLVPTEEMVQKIKTMKEITPDLIIVARTDALAVEGLEEAIQRANAYVKAGAHVIFPEALRKEEEFVMFKKKVHAPLLANMTEFGKTPYFTKDEFDEMGYALVIYPVTSMRVAAKAYERVFKEIKEAGTQKNMLDHMQTREELYETIHLHDYETLDASIAKTVLPTVEDES
ncbi:methylisocitrate lyase [Pseudogracilibacillus sp. ICA-222130]|uniref:methylisocitrate lyase n=1 Tax=Pseudogracilibacillus sp. ICA-222130 TaxID=3134655 RepID=UPI0030BCBE5E